MPGLDNYNLTVVILRYLSTAKLMRVVAKISKRAFYVVYSSLIWQRIVVDSTLTTLIPDFNELTQLFTIKLREYEYIHAIDLSRIFISETNKEHMLFFCEILPKLKNNLREFYHPRWLPPR
jgi:hypothetical protein